MNQLKELDQQVEAIERALAHIRRENPMVKLLADIGFTTATALAATAADPTMFRCGPEFAA